MAPSSLPDLFEGQDDGSKTSGSSGFWEPWTEDQAQLLIEGGGGTTVWGEDCHWGITDKILDIYRFGGWAQADEELQERRRREDQVDCFLKEQLLHQERLKEKQLQQQKEQEARRERKPERQQHLQLVEQQKQQHQMEEKGTNHQNLSFPAGANAPHFEGPIMFPNNHQDLMQGFPHIIGTYSHIESYPYMGTQYIGMGQQYPINYQYQYPLIEQQPYQGGMLDQFHGAQFAQCGFYGQAVQAPVLINPQAELVAVPRDTSQNCPTSISTAATPRCPCCDGPPLRPLPFHSLLKATRRHSDFKRRRCHTGN